MALSILKADTIAMRDVPRILGRFATSEFPAGVQQLAQKLQMSVRELLTYASALANSTQRSYWTDLLRDGRCYCDSITVPGVAGNVSQAQIGPLVSSSPLVRMLLHKLVVNCGVNVQVISGTTQGANTISSNAGPTGQTAMLCTAPGPNHAGGAGNSLATSSLRNGTNTVVGAVAGTVIMQNVGAVAAGVMAPLLGTGGEDVVFELSPGNFLSVATTGLNQTLTVWWEWAELPEDGSYF